jgi:YidC/Oxa1 family membrane protein insertase
LKEYSTHDSKPLILFDGDSTVFGFNFFTAGNKAIRTNDLYFTTFDTESYIDASTQTGTAIFRLNTTTGGYIEYRYSLDPGEYMLELSTQFVDLSSVIAANQNSLTLTWQSYIPQQEKGRTNEYNYTQLKYKHYQDVVDGFRERSQKDFEEADVPTKLRWVSFKDQFFSTALIAEESFINGYVTSTGMTEDSKYLKFFTAELGVPYNPNDNSLFQMHLFMGPNHFKTLKSYGYELEEVIFLGKNIIKWINQIVIIQIFNFLNRFIGSYGLIILILTIIIKTALYPLTFKSYQSQAKMKVLKPMVDEITKKFPKKEDALKKQQATMALYKKAGVSPLGGCLPMALQMPILFAMFRFFPASIELRQESFLWAKDLSTYDSILDLPFTIPMYGDHISLFTLLMTISTILTTRLNSPSSTGQEQVPGMKMMMYMMPIMFMLILNNFSSGLTYYYFLANIITLGQNWFSKSFINEGEVLAKLEANKKNPVTKSKFQQRLEAAAKQRGIKTSKK